jgi:uroporphyrinogen-III synthase
VKNFSKILKSTPYWEQIIKIPTLTIGPVTTETAKQEGFNLVGMPREYTIAGMVEKILQHFHMGKG